MIKLLLENSINFTPKLAPHFLLFAEGYENDWKIPKNTPCNICWNYMYLVKNVYLISIFPQVKICTAKKTCPYKEPKIVTFG